MRNRYHRSLLAGGCTCFQLFSVQTIALHWTKPNFCRYCCRHFNSFIHYQNEQIQNRQTFVVDLLCLIVYVYVGDAISTQHIAWHLIYQYLSTWIFFWIVLKKLTLRVKWCYGERDKCQVWIRTLFTRRQLIFEVDFSSLQFCISRTLQFCISQTVQFCISRSLQFCISQTW